MAVRSIPSGFTRGWQLKVNGQVVDKVTEVELYQWGFARNSYGLKGTPEKGFDANEVRQFFLGGTIDVPYAVHPKTKVVYVGTMLQARDTHGKVRSLPRGYVVKADQLRAWLLELKAKADEQKIKLTLAQVWEAIHAYTGAIELSEEMIDAPKHLTVHRHKLLGRPANMNNGVFNTVTMDNRELSFLLDIFGWTNEELEQMVHDVVGGDYFMRVEVPWELLVEDTTKPDAYKVVSTAYADQGVLEGVLKCEFRPIDQVLHELDDPTNSEAGDAYTEIGVSRLERFLR